MITKQMASVCCEQTDFVTAKKLCKGLFGFEPKIAPSSARRNLFGSDDSQVLKSATIVREFLSEATQEMAEKAARVWNFDFMTETPVEGGRYLWEKVKSCDVPDWYTSTSIHRKTQDKKFQSSDSSVGEKENTVLVPVCTNNTLGSKRVKCNSKTKLVQTSIRGWTRVQKRRRTSSRLRLKRLDDTTRYERDCILRGPSKSS